MRTTPILAICLWMCLFFGYPLNAQVITSCGPEVAIDTGAYTGSAFFNFGSSARIKSNTYKTAAAVGQVFTGYSENVIRNSTLGFYARYFLPPFALQVKATQGDLLDRIQVTWEVDQLGPSPTGGFNLYRDGIFLAHLEAEIHSYNDFNVIAGRPYVYCVEGVNTFGTSVCTEAIGFQVPNGVVTGWISTINGTPVPDAEVILTPMQGFSAKFGQGDGAFAMQDTSTTPFLPALDHDWTIAFWIKTDTFNNGRIIGMDSLYIRPKTGNKGGIWVSKTAGGTPYLAADFLTGKHEWHHVAIAYDGNGNKYRMYFDGNLAAIATSNPVPPPDTISFGALANVGNTFQRWIGRLDEVRIYDRALDELDFDMVMDGTASSETPNLTHYWKMDEELGVKSYDIVKRQKLYLCSATFDADRPPVHTAGITNEAGYYKIESASYGTGTTFLAKPKKNFYLHRALKFERAENDYATLPDFSITKKATFEVWVSNAAPAGTQTIISKSLGGQQFRLELIATANELDNTINVHFNGTNVTYGTLGQGSDYRHLAITYDSLTHKINVYKNGVKVNQANNTFPVLINNNWSNPNNPWYLGRQPGGQNSFDGLIDEVAIYDSILPDTTIANHYQSERNINEIGLRVYFALDEGSGTKLHNAGSVLMNYGTAFQTDWSPLAAHQVIKPHEFAPSTRQVTLNPSVTSVDQVDFTDRSTIAVSGYVRYKNSDCFAKDVEILVNGSSYIPKILTDSTGKFIIDFDPGTSTILTPKFEDHIFTPVSWEITNLSSPIAGILFNDNTTRKITGQIAGGECKLSIINANSGCIIKVSSADGCLEQYLNVTDADGEYTFDNLPPLEKMEVAIVAHNDPNIFPSFENAGGAVVDLTKKDSMGLDFIYFAPPIPEIQSGLDPYSDDCDAVVLEQGFPYTLNIKFKEHYYGGDCYLDTADFHIINGFGDEVLDTVMANQMLQYQFYAGTPNTSPPFYKTLQIIGKTEKGVEGSLTVQAIVTGLFAKENTFTTLMPEIPSLILRDPPGDGSYSYLEKNEKFCQKSDYTVETEVVVGGGLKVILGLDEVAIIAPLGVGEEIKWDQQSDLGFDAQVTYQRTSETSFETCTSIDSRVSTSPDDLIVGGERGGDLYMGTAFNIIYGNVDIVDFDGDICEADYSTAVLVQPGDFATTFIYSEFYILGTLIPALTVIYEDPETPITDTARYGESIRRWEAIVHNNAVQKEKAKFIKNISFDAGSEYEYAETSDTTSNEAIENIVKGEFKLEANFGFTIKGVGLEATIRASTATSGGERNESGASTGITTGYALKDNDPLDAFTFDIAMDSVYKTPVFNLKAGQSSCPWEPGTANREGTSLEIFPGYDYVVTNVPANEAAIFKFLMGNKSATNEQWTYSFTAIGEENPHGAVIKLNGAPLNFLDPHIIPFGEVDTVTITVERGPEYYDYDELLVAAVSECELERNLALSIPLEDDEKFFSGVHIGVHFIRPCTEVKITVPAQQEWVIYPNNPLTTNDDLLTITASGYDLNEPSFSRIQVQYRRTGGDGAWLPIGTRWNPNYDDIPVGASLLSPVFQNFSWNTVGYEDGNYEIRAITVCENTVPNQNGYSEILKGRIDRQPPALVGVPQPSDGVLQVGDEISFTFNQTINCQDIMAVLIDHVNLYNTRTDALIHTNVTCGDNKIVIDPTDQNFYFENDVVRAELDDIADMTGNVLAHTDWEFYVDRNELAWLTDSAGITKYENEEKSVTVKIHNRGGYPVAFTIDSIPEGVHVTPNAGTLVANEIRDIQITAANTLDRSWIKDSIVLFTDPGAFMSGVEALPFAVRTICRPPDWEVDPTLYQLSMTMVARIQFDTAPPYNNYVFSDDPEDQVAAFINGELRGTAKLVQSAPNNTYKAFVTIYGNTADIGDSLTFELFNASECKHYPAFISPGGTFNFATDGTQGTPGGPKVLQNYGPLLSDVPLHKGWNWISFNLGFPDPTINQALHNIPNATGDLIKDQTHFAVYNNGTWTGSLTSITNTSAYLYQAAKPNNIKIIGDPLTPASVHIPIVQGMNWIGYIPTYSLPVTTALASLNPSAGDIIKSQDAFAQYVGGATSSWVGNLKTMEPLHGYLLKIAAPGTLTYPLPLPFTSDEHIKSRSPESLTSFWNVDASQYEFNMTLIGNFQYDEMNATTASMELGAFLGDELRGVGEAVYVEYLDTYVFFMTGFANKSGEQLHFKLYDHNTGNIQDLKETMAFVPNMNEGSIEEPVPFTLQTTGVGDVESDLSFNVQPNPFREETVCRFELPEAQEVHIIVTDMDGKNLYVKQIQGNAGMNSFVWKGSSTGGTLLSNGVYFIRLETEEGILTKKVMLQR